MCCPPADARPRLGQHNGGVTIDVELLHTMAGLERACAVFSQVWGPSPEVVPVDLAAAVVHVGGYCAVAVQAGVDVGASFGFRGWHDGPVLHSHVTAVAAPGAGVGYALKLHQRQWAHERGIDTITWTFDPLVRRNAYFNLVKLGCRVSEYLPDFYGEMTDAINAGDKSDRLMAVWRYGSPMPGSRDLAGAHIAVAATPQGPVTAGIAPGTVNLVELPADIEAMRAAGDPLVAQWREATRTALTQALRSGMSISGMHNGTSYILEES